MSSMLKAPLITQIRFQDDPFLIIHGGHIEGDPVLTLILKSKMEPREECERQRGSFTLPLDLPVRILRSLNPIGAHTQSFPGVLVTFPPMLMVYGMCSGRESMELRTLGKNTIGVRTIPIECFLSYRDSSL